MGCSFGVAVQVEAAQASRKISTFEFLEKVFAGESRRYVGVFCDNDVQNLKSIRFRCIKKSSAGRSSRENIPVREYPRPGGQLLDGALAVKEVINAIHIRKCNMHGARFLLYTRGGKVWSSGVWTRPFLFRGAEYVNICEVLTSALYYPFSMVEF